ncbi:hypothetical protein R3X28_00890 [Maribacter sp. TH_r10]|uniref:YtxH domain-containing protein n=1 Tax=Maribacter luteus TaxID=2594478 RepID=A0A6I2MJT0_9FLAO|nr:MULTISPECIES: hypothetical protein [Maribacter]MDV7137406.1 hypothetical protein [Maribacter sp. TH_r10]MRX64131.1 hypothetical protein [Maribacter luteus]
MRKSLVYFIVASFFTLSLSTFVGCREDKSAKEKVEEGIEEVGDGIEEGAEEIGDEIDDATDDN